MRLRGLRAAIVSPVIAKLRGEQTTRWLVQNGAQIGVGVSIGRYSVLDEVYPWLISVGDYTTISDSVKVIAHDAALQPHFQRTVIAPVAIGGWVYIGAGSLILPGVTIGDGAIVGAGSVVRRDVPPRAVVMGNPAEVVGTTDDFAARHAARIPTSPTYDGSWTLGGGISPERQAEMREQLRHSRGYTEERL